MLELTLDTDLEAEQAEYLTLAKSSAEALLKVIDDILDFSKIESGKLEFETIDFNLRDCLGDTLDPLGVRAEQKGLDLVLENIAYLIQLSAQLLVLGTGDPELEAGFKAAAAAHPGRVATSLGFVEGLAHRILAGADVVMVHSRAEPCGLTQLYALRYGALPLVRRTGGLADTVVDANPHSVLDSTATGFVFQEPSSWLLGETIGRACKLYRQDPKAWARIQRHGMGQDFGWEAAAREYLDLYGHI